MPSQLLKRLMEWRSSRLRGQKLYGAIVAQARLPVFCRSLSVADTVEGRFGLVVLHLFAVLHSLQGQSEKGAPLAQALTDRFAEDMETVLREMGVSDLKVPKKMRSLAASSRGLIDGYEAALKLGPKQLAATIAEALPFVEDCAGPSSVRLSSYVRESIEHIERQSLLELEEGIVAFAEVPIKQ